MINFIKSNILECIAITISIISLFFSLKEHFKSIVKLRIKQTDNIRWSFGFRFYGEYQLFVTYIQILNSSKSDVTISSIYAKYNNTIYKAIIPPVCDILNKKGIRLFVNDDLTSGININFTSENILNSPRLESRDAISGFIVIDDFPILNKKSNIDLFIETPEKTFKVQIEGEPLPEKYRVRHPLNKQ